MNLHRLLKQREERGEPLRVGLIGAGKFGSMYLAQVRHTPGVRMVAIADLDVQRARAALREVGWSDASIAALRYFEDARRLIDEPDIDVVIDATGSPAAGIAHVLACCERGKHVVMVNVEADALAGPLLAERARAAGIVYSLAYGDQ
nr:Gfo/Idh/MocA family oxidoreductase [Burkholderiaceae bacterium]